MAALHEVAAYALLPFVTKFAGMPWHIHQASDISHTTNADDMFATSIDEVLIPELRATNLTSLSLERAELLVQLALVITDNRRTRRLNWIVTHGETSTIRCGRYTIAEGLTIEASRWLMSTAERIRLTKV